LNLARSFGTQVDLHSSVFTHGQLYVAVSCVRSKNGVKAIWDSKIAQPVTKKIVLTEFIVP